MAKIFVHDEYRPEEMAMLQALYSRSAQSVENHIEKVKTKGPDDFMKSYYVGYGHASIGDCGFTTLFFEGVSMLAAKAIQDNPLYCGQETSTRYLDFSEQPVINPSTDPKAQAVLDRWNALYKRLETELIPHVEAQHPIEEDQDEVIWKKTIKARVFDITRGFLPAGATTQLSWATNLRQAHDNLERLRTHPLKEVQVLAQQALELLQEKYPSSFSHKEDEVRDEYLDTISEVQNYCSISYRIAGRYRCEWDIKTKGLPDEEKRAIYNRPKGALLPRYLKKCGTAHLTIAMDYGSFRDLQRHRNGLCRIPLIDHALGFNSWYLHQLPKALCDEVTTIINEQYLAIRDLVNDEVLTPFEAQYLYPMGTNVATEVVYDLPEMVYVAELRSSKTVHPTMRQIAHDMVKSLDKHIPGIALHADLDGSDFTLRRGHQDIVSKDSAATDPA